VSVESFHDFLWRYSDSKGKVFFTISDMAEHLGMHEVSIKRILGGMVRDGRLKKSSKHSRTFYCVNPALYREEHNIFVPERGST